MSRPRKRNRGVVLQVEIATFRTAVSYTDGRRPDQVQFSSPREDALRLLLFGGGFPREALIELCRTRLQALRGQP